MNIQGRQFWLQGFSWGGRAICPGIKAQQGVKRLLLCTGRFLLGQSGNFSAGA